MGGWKAEREGEGGKEREERVRGREIEKEEEGG